MATRPEPEIVFLQFDIVDAKGVVRGSGLRVGTSGAVVAWIKSAAGRKLELVPYPTPEDALVDQPEYALQWRPVAEPELAVAAVAVVGEVAPATKRP